MKQGAYPDIPFKDYLALDAVSNSYLGRFDQCPAKAKVEQPDTPAMALGRAVHTLVLEGREAFDSRYAVAPEINRRTNAGKEEWAAFLQAAEDEGKEVITPEDETKAMDMRKAVFSHPFAKKLLAEGVSEQTIVWEDRKTGLLCKGRPDRVPGEKTATLIDLKTTADASEDKYLRSVINFGYARAAAFYIDGYGAASGVYVDSMVHIVVEKEEPYRVEVYALDDELVAWGREEYRRLLADVKRCKESGEFPNYRNEGVVTLYKPGWL